MGKRLFRHRIDGNLLLVAAQTLEADNTVGLGKQRVIAADTDVGAGVDVGAALAHKNVAGENELTVSALGAKALGVRVAAVLRGAAALLVGEKLKTDVQLYEADIGLFPYMALLSFFSYV